MLLYDKSCVPHLLYLIHFVPLGMQVLLDGLALEISVTDSDCCVGV